MQKIKKITLTFLFFILTLSLFFIAPAFSFADEKEVYLGGIPAGFTLGLGGVQIVGMCEVLTDCGARCPARDAEISIGDVIKNLNGIKIESAQDLDTVLSKEIRDTFTVNLLRNGEEKTTEIQPVKEITSGKNKLGVLVRDSVSGIGTVTYIEKDTLKFGSLGHPVLDECGNCMSVNGGKIYNCSIVNVIKGVRGKAGELKGVFLNDKHIATANENCIAGIFGKFENDFDFSNFKKVKVASIDEVEQGKASIYSTIDGLQPKKYSVSIIKIDKYNKQNKNFVIKITDNELLAQTGGIVQGMSGSPIIQNGKLIGAVTHVFLNDPTRGYAISIENMLNY